MGLMVPAFVALCAAPPLPGCCTQIQASQRTPNHVAIDPICLSFFFLRLTAPWPRARRIERGGGRPGTGGRLAASPPVAVRLGRGSQAVGRRGGAHPRLAGPASEMLRGGQPHSIDSLEKAPLDEESPLSRHWVQSAGGLLPPSTIQTVGLAGCPPLVVCALRLAGRLPHLLSHLAAPGLGGQAARRAAQREGAGAWRGDRSVSPSPDARARSD